MGRLHNLQINITVSSRPGNELYLQFGVDVSHKGLNAGIRWLLGSVEVQGELLQGTGMGSWSLESSNQTPLSARILSPGVGGHEGPVGESVLAIVILGAAGKDHSPAKRVTYLCSPARQLPGSHGRDKVESGVSTTAGVEGDNGLDVLEVVDFGGGSNAGIGVQFKDQVSVLRDLAKVQG